MRKVRKTRMMIKEQAIGLAVLIALALAIAIPQSASAVSLKQNSIVDGDVITLGDIFSGLEDKSDRVLGPAPRPGHDMTLNARTLMRVAVAMDLPWRPASTADQVVLSRAATVVSRSMIEDTLKNELSTQGLQGKFQLAMAPNAREIILPVDANKSVEVETLEFDTRQDRFEATLVAPSKDEPIKRIKISGAVQRLVGVPVLRDTLRNGSVIGKNDLEYVDMRADFLNHDIIMDEEELLGMTPRRMILPGKPMKANEIQAPMIVERGEMVTMQFNDGLLSLTAQGKAMENGAKGDVIRVVNSTSSRTIQAKVTGVKEVTVESF